MPQMVQVDARVPIELVDLIAFHLRPTDLTISPGRNPVQSEQGLAGLRACSLVCHQWRALVLSHLFFNITFNFRGPVDLSSEVDNYSKDVEFCRRYKTICQFCAFLDATPEISRCIRQLKLVGQSSISFADITGPPLDEQLECFWFSRLLLLCPQLDALHLLGVFLRNPYNPPPSERKALQVLKIHPCHKGDGYQRFSACYEDGGDVAPLLFFSSIQHLHLSTPVYRFRSLPQTMTLPPLEVHHLELEKAAYGLKPFTDALERSGAARTVRHLTTTQCNRPHYIHGPPYESSALQELLALVSPTLETVKVRRFPNLRWQKPIVPLLSACAQLHLLIVDFDLRIDDLAAVADAVVRLLRSVPLNAPLERIDVHVALPGGARTSSKAAYAAFGAVDDALAQVVCACHTLPWILVMVSSDGEDPLLEPDVRRLFQKVNGMGKLRVQLNSGDVTVI